MAKVISQETFDEVVKENVMEFSMSVDEARDETIKQFEAQGINLANVVKDLSINADTGVPILNETIEQLNKYISEATDNTEQLLELLTVLDGECQKSLSHRVLAGKIGAQDVIIFILDLELAEPTPNNEILRKCLITLNSLTTKQPDIFNDKSLSIALKLLKNEDEQIVKSVLQWLQKASIMHENNRQTIMQANIVLHLKPYVVANDKNPKLIREVVALFRYLVLDDDIRVEFSSAHEHARLIASEVIVDITNLLGEIEDSMVLADLLLTLGTLTVRQEFCTTIETAGGLSQVFNIMAANPNSARVNREALKLLRALAGNDTVKSRIVKEGVAPLIKQILQTHMTNELVVTAALACVSTLTLRVKDNSAIFFETGIADPIVETMRLHPNNKTVQRNASWAVRNMVSRSREQCETWLSLGIEELLNAALSNHLSVKQDVKAALRDLGCKVDLKEEWTGTAEKKIVNA